jgi:hypothetical protein
MRIIRTILIAALVTSSTACLVTASGGTGRPLPPPGAPQGAVVTGTITDARTRAPISQAAVDIVRPDHSQVTSVSTDAAGHFTTDGVPPDGYIVRVRRNGYAGKTVNTNLHAGTNQVSVALDPK